MRQEHVGEEHDFLFGFPRVHGMNREQLRCELAGLRFAGFADRDARVDTREPVIQLGCGLDNLPPVRAVETGIGGQQSLRQRRAAAHHPDHDDRRDDRLVRDLRMPFDPLVSA